MDFADLKNVEIFAVGKWNGEMFTEADLDAMAMASKEVGYKPPVKLGHSKEIGGPALGWMENIRREGSKLMADIMDIPQKVYEAIKDRRYDQRSVEIYENLKRNGKEWPRAIKALALLGADIPAVSDLKPLSEIALAEGSEFKTVSMFSMEIGQGISLKEKVKAEMKAEQEAQVSKELEAKVKELEQKLEEASKKPAAVDFAQSDQYKQMDAKIKAMEESARKSLVDGKTSAVKLPAFKPYVQALYDMATAGTREIEFTQGDKTEKLNQISVLDKLVEILNSGTVSKLFTQAKGAAIEFPGGEGIAEGGNSMVAAGAALDRQTRELMASKSIKDYNEAWKLIKTDPKNSELVKIYSETPEA